MANFWGVNVMSEKYCVESESASESCHKKRKRMVDFYIPKFYSLTQCMQGRSEVNYAIGGADKR